METERHEIYERIPWETLERRGTDRQWLYVGLAGAVALGALAYSFMRSQPAEPTAIQPAATTAPATVIPDPQPPPTTASPLVVAEADLYAVDPERLIDSATAHAEWFAVEYFSVDGSPESAEVLASLLPTGVPLPQAPEGTQVFVDWVGAQRVTEVAVMRFQVDVLVRSLVSTADSGFVRQPPRLARVEIAIGDDGTPKVTAAPVLVVPSLPAPAGSGLQSVPPDVLASLAVDGSVVGGTPAAGGGWHVVVMAAGTDGVIRPVTVLVR